MNRYPTWKYLLVLAVTVLGLLLFLPNMFGEDPALQVSEEGVESPDQFTVDRVRSELDEADVAYQGVALEDGRVMVRFADTEDQIKAADILRDSLGTDFTVALNLLPRMPEWLESLGVRPMNLGLDLRGGIHFLLDVDMQTLIEQRMDGYEEGFKADLREAGIRYAGVDQDRNSIRLRFADAETRDRAQDLLSDDYDILAFEQGDDDQAEPTLTASIPEQAIRDLQDFAVQQNITTLRNRVNELGVSEPVVQRQGRDRIVIQLPGVQDPARAKNILSATATLEFRLNYTNADPYAARRDNRVPLEAKLYENKQGQPVLLKREVITTGDHLTDASAGFAQDDGSPAVFLTLDSEGADRMSEVTRRNVNKPMSVVFIEVKQEGGRTVREETVINTATIRDVLSKRFQISGLEPQESRNLALLLRAGALAAPVQIIEERTVGPSLGRDNIEQGFQAVIIGFLLVIVFMAIYYRAFGLIADLALLMNLVLIVALLSLLQATLTLPGIAGIVLTVGMAVDANVLIFERIREELRNGNTPQASIQSGYEKAFSTIADANVTTLIAAIVLFSFGTGPIKGFAVTLSLGIMTSMFTAIVGTRAVVNLLFGNRRLSKLYI